MSTEGSSGKDLRKERASKDSEHVKDGEKEESKEAADRVHSL